MREREKFLRKGRKDFSEGGRGGSSETGSRGGGGVGGVAGRGRERERGERGIDFNCLKDKASDPRIIQRIAFQFQSKVRLLILPRCFH